MPKQHPFLILANKIDRSDAENALLNAIVKLNVSVYADRTFEQVYDALLEGSSAPPTFTVQAVINQLNRMEKLLMSTSTGVQRLQTDAAALSTQLAAMQAAQTQMATDLEAANARLLADITALMNNVGSGDSATLTSIAQSLETTLAGYQTVTSQLQATDAAEVATDQLVITPTSATVVLGGTQSFSANTPVNWSAINGTIDTSGNYTAPASGASDTVTATTTDGTQSATASITLLPAPTGNTAAPAAAVKPTATATPNAATPAVTPATAPKTMTSKTK